MEYKNFSVTESGAVNYMSNGIDIHVNTFWIRPPQKATETCFMDIRQSAWEMAAACLDEEVEE